MKSQQFPSRTNADQQRKTFIEKPISFLTQRSCHENMSMEWMAKIVSAKNSKYKYSQYLRDTCLDWTKKKGVDLHPLLDRLQILKRIEKEKEKKKKEISQCYFYMPALTLENQQNYIRLSGDFQVLNCFNYIYGKSCQMSIRGKTTFSQRYLRKRETSLSRTGNNSTQASKLFVFPAFHKQCNQASKIKYVQIVKNCLEKSSEVFSNQWILAFFQQNPTVEFWKILKSQIDLLPRNQNIIVNLSTKEKENAKIRMMIKSLKMIECKFSQAMPKSDEGLCSYFDQKYGRIFNSNQYLIDLHRRPTWGLIYILFQSGQTNRIRSLMQQLNQNQLSEMLKNFNHSIQSNNLCSYSSSETSTQLMKNGDVFHDQLIEILQGSPKYIKRQFFNPESLEFSWALLRIFLVSSSNCLNQILMKDLKSKLHERYQFRNCGNLSESQILNILFLQMYEYLAEVGPNSLMDSCDFLHFLITVYYTPNMMQIMCPHNLQRQKVQKSLCSSLNCFIQELITQKNPYFQNYLILFPNNHLASQVSEIICASRLFEVINWEKIRSYISASTFEKLVEETLRKHISIYNGSYESVIRKSYSLLGDNHLIIPMSFIVQYFVSASIQELKTNDTELQSIKIMANQILQSNRNIFINYKDIIEFYCEFQKCNRLLQEKNIQGLYEFLRQCGFIIFSFIHEQFQSCNRFKGTHRYFDPSRDDEDQDYHQKNDHESDQDDENGEYFPEDSRGQPQYKSVFSVEENQEDSSVSLDQNISRIEEMQFQTAIKSEKLFSPLYKLLNKLLKIGSRGIASYLIYLEKIEKSFELVLLPLQEMTKLNQIQQSMYDGITYLFHQNENFMVYRNLNEVQNFINHLELCLNGNREFPDS